MSDTDQGTGVPWADEKVAPAGEGPSGDAGVPPADTVEEPKEPDTVANVMRDMFLHLSDRIERTTQRQPGDHAIMTGLVTRLKALK